MLPLTGSREFEHGGGRARRPRVPRAGRKGGEPMDYLRLRVLSLVSFRLWKEEPEEGGGGV